MYVGSFIISAGVHFVVKYSTQTIDMSDIASLILPELQIGVITLLAVFISSQLFTQDVKVPEENKMEVVSELESPTKKIEEDEKPMKAAKKVEIIT